MSASFYSNSPGVVAASGQVNYTAMLLARVGSITRLISVSSYLVMCSVLQSAPLSLALEVLLGLGQGQELDSQHGAPASSTPSTSTAVLLTIEEGRLSGTPLRSVFQSAPNSTAPQAPAMPMTPATPLSCAELRSLDDMLSSIHNSLILVAHNSLADDLNPGSSVAKSKPTTSQTPGKAAPGPSTALDMQGYKEFASRNILSRLPGKAMWSLLSSDPATSPLSPALLQSLQACASQHSGSSSSGGVIEVLQRRLNNFLSMKFDEQVALSALLQRTVCLLSVVVLVCQDNNKFGRYDSLYLFLSIVLLTFAIFHLRVCRPPEGSFHTSVHYLQQIMEFLKIIDKLWKEIKGYLQRIPSGAAKVPAMRHVLHATAQVEIDNSILSSITCEAVSADSSPLPSAPAVGTSTDSTGRVSIAHKVDSASWKLVEKESAQARSILESAVLLHELRAELRSYVLAIRSLRALMRDTVGVVPPTPAMAMDIFLQKPSLSKMSMSHDTNELNDTTDVAAEQMEDLQSAQAMRLMMVSFGWEAPSYHGVPWNPTVSMTFYQASTLLSLPLVPLTGKNISSSRGSTPSASSANVGGLVGTVAGASVRRVPLINNLELRLEEFLAEYQTLESDLEEIIGGISTYR